MSQHPSPNTLVHNLSNPDWVDWQPARDQFAAAWQRGERPDIPQFLPVAPALWQVLDLCALALEFRLKTGDPARVEEYLCHFPELGQNAEALCQLVRVEFEQRRCREEVSVAEYARRFPLLGEDFSLLLDDTRLGAPPHPQPLSPNGGEGSKPPPTKPAKVVVTTGVPGYEILNVLGRGGSGVVYKARHVQLNRLVALKMLLGGAHAQAEELTRFQREANAIAQLEHPHIVKVYDYGEHYGQPFLALEYLDGGSLQQRLKEGPVPPRAAVELLATLARAVAFAHQRGIIHRDLKPANVLLQISDTGLALGCWERDTAKVLPKITDFGLVKRLEDTSDTVTGAVLGTPVYMAPEQAAGKSKEVGPAADIYSLGVMLFEILAGHPPFQGPSHYQVIQQVMEAAPPRLDLMGIHHGDDLNGIVQKCLEKNPGQRYRSAGELAEDLQRWLDGKETLARPLGPITRYWRGTRRHAKQMALGVVLVALLGAVVYLAYQSGQPLAAGAVLVALVGAVVYLVCQSGRLPTVVVPPANAEGEAFLQQIRADVQREVNHLRARQPHVLRAAHPSTILQKTLTRPDRSAFEFLEHRRVWDLRLWLPVPPERRHEPISAMCFNDRQRLKKIKPVDEYVGEVRTTGLDAFIEPISHPESFKIIAEQDRIFVGAEQMKSRQFILDIRGIPVDQEFEVRTATTFWNNLQDDKERWLGVIGYGGAFKVSMLFLFPQDRPIGDFELLVLPTGSTKQDPLPYTGRKTLLVGPHRDYLYWDILEPKANHVYIVKWQW